MFYCKDAMSLMQEFLVAVGVRGATLQHRVVPPSQSWYDQVSQAKIQNILNLLANILFFFLFNCSFSNHD